MGSFNDQSIERAVIRGLNRRGGVGVPEEEVHNFSQVLFGHMCHLGSLEDGGPEGGFIRQGAVVGVRKRGGGWRGVGLLPTAAFGFGTQTEESPKLGVELLSRGW